MASEQILEKVKKTIKSKNEHPSIHKQPCTLTLTPKDNLESPINLTCMFLDGGRKPEYSERYTGRTCKIHTERPQVGIKNEQTNKKK